MDITSRAIRLAEDSAAAVEALRSKLPLRKVYAGEISQTKTSFGQIKLSAPSAVIVVFTGDECSLEFGGKQIASGASPLVGIVTAGSGELSLSAARGGAQALLI